MNDSRNSQPPFYGPGFPNYPVHTQVVRIAGTAVGSTPSGGTIYAALTEQWAGTDFRDRESCYVVVEDNVGRLVGSYNGLPLYSVGAVSATTITVDFTDLTLIFDNTTLNFITNTSTFNFFVDTVFNFYSDITYVFQTVDVTVTITGGPTNVWIFEVPLKIDDWMFWGGQTYNVTDADLTDHGGGNITWDNFDPPSRTIVIRVVLNASQTLTGISPQSPPPSAPANNGQVLWLINCSDSAGKILTLKNLSSFSAAGNRFFLPGGYDVVIPQGGAIGLWYDFVDSEWKTLTMDAGGVTSGSVVVTNVTFDDVTCAVTPTYGTTINGRVQ